MAIYSDLDKKSKGGYIIEDALVLNEAFNTAINIKKGQIFYGRGYGYNIEQYLLRLNEPQTLMNIQSELYGLRSMDARLILNPAQTQLFSDTDNAQVLLVKAGLDIQGLPQLSIEALVEPDEDTEYLTVQKFFGEGTSPWVSRDDSGEIINE